MSEVEKTAQQEFDEIYITSSEIGQELGVCRATLVNARRRGLLPDPIVVNGAQITSGSAMSFARILTLGSLCSPFAELSLRKERKLYDHTRSGMGAPSS